MPSGQPRLGQTKVMTDPDGRLATSGPDGSPDVPQTASGYGLGQTAPDVVWLWSGPDSSRRPLDGLQFSDVNLFLAEFMAPLRSM